MTPAVVCCKVCDLAAVIGADRVFAGWPSGRSRRRDRSRTECAVIVAATAT